MSSELAYEASDEASENELLERSLSVWRGWSAIEWEDFTPIALDIHTACSIGHYEWVRSIILKNEGGIDLDRKNHGGWTPLMYACYIGHDNIVNLLINANCNMNAKNPRGLTPLMLAASCGNESVARTLVRRGAQLELVDNNGWTALFHATYAGHQNFVAFLLDAGANKNAREPNTGMTPFMEAAAEGHEIIAQLFLQHGVNVHSRTQSGHMARSLALLNGYMKIVSMIDNHVMPASCLRSEAGLDFYLNSSDESEPRKQHPSGRNVHLNSQGPSIRDGPEAIARMIDRTRNSEAVAYHPSSLIPKGYVSFPAGVMEKEETKLSYRDVTSPISPEDYKDSSGSRESDDFNDDSNAFTKTGAITIKSSSSSSGGLMAALGLSREGSIDSDDSQSCDPLTGSSEGNFSDVKGKHGVSNTKESPISQFSTPGSKSESDLSSGAGLSPNQKQKSNKSSEKDMQTLSPLKVPEKGENSDGGEHGSKVVSPLRDYFPLDSSFPVAMTPPPTAESQITSTQMSTENPPVSSHQSLPKDNMTHTEIVNRFLKNLTLDSSEKSGTQYGMFENRWASNTPNDASGGPTDDQEGPRLPEKQDRSLPDEDMGYECHGSQSLNNAVQDDGMKEMGEKAHSKMGLIHGPFGSNVNAVPSDGLTTATAAQRTHHPQLNHHHPLHNRHHHNTHTHYQDASINNVQYPSSHPPAPFRHNLPQEYFYSNLETAAQHLQPSFTGNSAIQATDLAAAQNSGIAQPVSTGNPLAHLMAPLVENNLTTPGPVSNVAAGQNFPNIHHERAALEQASSSGFQTVVENGTAPRDLFQQTPTVPSIPLPATTTGAYNSHPQQRHHHQLPTPQVRPDVVTSAATVIIPGHATSQPVSSGISWLSPREQNTDGPRDLAEMLNQLGLTKYLEKFEEQDVDLQVFLSLTDNDLKELGIKLFGPRKKMTNAIARWHSNAPMASSSLEQAYADKLEGEMQEMALQLNQAYENEEHLKAQVRQEQQLRSVTEGCLMEERANWEQARHLLQETRGSMRTMGDLLSRLRLHHKELRKQLEKVVKQTTSETPAGQSQVENPERSEKKSAAAEASQVTEKKKGNPSSHFSTASAELLKKSEKCLKEMQQTLTNLVHAAEHILKSTHNVSNVDKNI